MQMKKVFSCILSRHLYKIVFLQMFCGRHILLGFIAKHCGKITKEFSLCSILATKTCTSNRFSTHPKYLNYNIFFGNGPFWRSVWFLFHWYSIIVSSQLHQKGIPSQNGFSNSSFKHIV